MAPARYGFMERKNELEKEKLKKIENENVKNMRRLAFETDKIKIYNIENNQIKETNYKSLTMIFVSEND